MTINTQLKWKEQLLAPLEESQQAAPIADDNPDWEYIDGEMIKFGSLSHAQLNIEEIQRKALQLFANETKDFRLLVHLLRTLQHAGEADELALAAELLAEFVRHYWENSYPQNIKLKQRLAGQILKRFETVQDSFCRQADINLRDNILGSFAFLAKSWHEKCPNLSAEVDTLSRGYSRIEQSEPVIVVATEEPTTDKKGAVENTQQAQTPVAATKVPTVEVNQTDERQWKQTLLKVAEALCEQTPSDAVGYCLRRYAIWHSIHALPMANNDGKTPLAPVSPDRVIDYKNQMAQPSMALLNNIEQSLTLSPYWLEGHMLAAQVATKLGYPLVGVAIAQALQQFLNRLPDLAKLSFSDMTPFLPEEVQSWLSASQKSTSHDASTSSHSLQAEQQEILHCYEQHGLSEALKMVENFIASTNEPRARFYSQLLSAQLFEQAGMQHMAENLYQQLHTAALHYSLSDWEPDLLNRLAQKVQDKQEMTFDRNSQQ
ncbi:type VI secretion system protein TssA [Providencia stuartii]|uniref:type VI secretion system protein TssA n=1 Tax=Providencia TaxID=586 RepID=UPI000CE67200|nr:MULTISPECIES: type VI secretion system protein TssA [Providencia]AVE41502.1 type VI secretion system protein TssA [Providencia stuartii]MBN5558303.1 type VI secretion system protein TssA [Providencia stuartii]MBQ0458033.1 type VI secretion system protein TssA [Providencia stuartii]MBQ0695313.1 type VI secretion system protein TssA [Providencia stuartii]NMT49108.1 type VI secretion system protein TssA [Providencia stuartii]